MTDGVEKVAELIRALLARTMENGCTEAEALTAAAKVAEMLAKHDLSMEQVVRGDDVREGVKKSFYPASDVVGQFLSRPAQAIAEMCQVRLIVSAIGRRTLTDGVYFLGFRGDVEISTYLLRIVEAAMQRECAALSMGLRTVRESVRTRRQKAFLDGMSKRLAERIAEISWTRRRNAGTGLVVAKFAVIDEELDRMKLHTRRGTGRTMECFDGFDSGRNAADRVAFEAAVKDDTAPKDRLA